MSKKISKVIVYYEDGTYEEVKAGISNTPDKPNKENVSPSPVIPDMRPDYYKIRDWGTPTWVPNTGDPLQPPWTVTCKTTDNVPLNYTVSSDARDMTTWSFTSTGNADNLNKYTITSTGNGNVDLSK
jgi:hypothetical protein